MEELKAKLHNGTYKAVDVSSMKGYRSSIWKNFCRIFDEEGKKLNFVLCNSCQNIYGYSTTTGTSGMQRHKCRHIQMERKGTARIDGHSPVTNVNLPPPERIFIQACTNFVVKDLQAYYSFSGEGFRDIIQAAIEIGASKGRVSAETIIPDCKTLAAHCKELAIKERLKLVTALKRIGCYAVTADIWTDDFRKIPYLTLMVHYVDENWNLKDCVLCTRNLNEHHPGENICEQVRQILQEFELWSSHFVLVTHQASDMTAAFQLETHLVCCAHLLNNVLEWVFEKDTNPQSANLCLVQQVIRACVQVVACIKQSNKLPQFKKTLKQIFAARWNIHLCMLQSIDEHFELLEQVLLDAGEKPLLTNINHDLIKLLITFLRPFKEMTDLLEASCGPTLHQVVPLFKSLHESLTPDTTEPQYMAELKASASDYLKKHLHFSKLHLIAMFLNPKMRSLKALTEDERENLLKDIVAVVGELSLAVVEDQLYSSLPINDHLYSPDQPVKRRKTGLLEVWEDDDVALESQNHSNSILAEVELYKKLPVPTDTELDILKWWGSHFAELPLLSKLAKRVLCIPATSAPSERNSSSAEGVVTKERSSLKPKNVDDILFLHSNLAYK